jgi:hypothetical protein
MSIPGTETYRRYGMLPVPVGKAADGKSKGKVLALQ